VHHGDGRFAQYQQPEGDGDKFESEDELEDETAPTFSDSESDDKPEDKDNIVTPPPGGVPKSGSVSSSYILLDSGAMVHVMNLKTTMMTLHIQRSDGR
jgi:hypothetical protein